MALAGLMRISAVGNSSRDSAAWRMVPWWKYGTRPDVSTKGYSSSDSGLSAGSMYEQMGL